MSDGRSGSERHLEILHAVAETVGRSLDVEEVLRTALDALTHVTGHEISSLHLVSEDGLTLELRGDRGLSPERRAIAWCAFCTRLSSTCWIWFSSAHTVGQSARSSVTRILSCSS